MKNHRFLWLRNRTTNNRKCEKARNIKEKRTIEMLVRSEGRPPCAPVQQALIFSYKCSQRDAAEAASLFCSKQSYFLSSKFLKKWAQHLRRTFSTVFERNNKRFPRG